jgi:hypothetical protein
MYTKKGLFSECYFMPDNTVRVYSVCQVKEGLSLWRDKTNTYLPDIELSNSIDNSSGINSYFETDNNIDVYKMPLYRDLLKANLRKGQWDHYKWIKENLSGIRDYNEFSKMLDESSLPKRMKDALQNIADCACNYSYMLGFEFTKRNMKEFNGRLLFLDVCFIPEQCKDRRKFVIRNRHLL